MVWSLLFLSQILLLAQMIVARTKLGNVWSGYGMLCVVGGEAMANLELR